MNAKHIKGAANELKAQVWFLDNGYQVFTPVIQQGIADFVVFKDGIFQSVQVKTAYYMETRGHSYLQVRLGRATYSKVNGNRTTTYDATSADDHFDILFAIYEDQMWLCPKDELPSDKKCIYFGESKRSSYNAALWKVAG